MTDDEQPNWVVIARAIGHGFDAEFKLGYIEKPDLLKVLEIQSNARIAFEQAFDKEPEHVAAVLLPWIDRIDGDDAE